MKIKSLQFSIILTIIVMLLTACNGQIPFAPSATITLTSTETPTPIPTSTLTVTPTLTPTETPIPQPASLSGIIYLLSGSTKPFISSVELRQGGDSFTLIASSKTDSKGVYKIENIDPGIYGLWILITATSTMIPGCNDVAPPDDAWKIGIEFGEDKSLTIENAYLSKALTLMEFMPSTSDLKAQGFFAVLDGFKIESGIENIMDVNLICK